MISPAHRIKTTPDEALSRAMELTMSENPQDALIARLETTLAAEIFKNQACTDLRDALCDESKMQRPWRLRVDTWENFRFDGRFADPKTRTELDNTVKTLMRYGHAALALNLVASIDPISDLSPLEKSDLTTELAAQNISTKTELLEKIEECFQKGISGQREAHILLEVGKHNGLFRPHANLAYDDAVPIAGALSHLRDDLETAINATSLFEIEPKRMVRFVSFDLNTTPANLTKTRSRKMPKAPVDSEEI